MASTKPTPVSGSVFTNPSPVTRDDGGPHTHAGARPGESGGNGATPAPAGVTGRDLGLAALSVVAAIARLRERREALAATVAGARASQHSDAVIRAHLVVNGLEQDEIDAAMG